MTKLSPSADALIESYLSLPFKNQTVSTPYFNNKRQRARGALRVLIGKGSPEDIVEEAYIFSIKEKIDLPSLSSDEMKRYLADHHLGVDCSAFAYYVLDAEMKARGKGQLSAALSYRAPILRRLLIRLRPVENTSVGVLADDANSSPVALRNIAPGDLIIMRGSGRNNMTDHVLAVTAVEATRPGEPVRVEYAHSLQWSSDGAYGHGVRRGEITIVDASKGILDQLWQEKAKTGEENETHLLARQAKNLSLRRLRFFQ